MYAVFVVCLLLLLAVVWRVLSCVVVDRNCCSLLCVEIRCMIVYVVVGCSCSLLWFVAVCCSCCLSLLVVCSRLLVLVVAVV